MSSRDTFIAAALSGLLANSRLTNLPYSRIQSLAINIGTSVYDQVQKDNETNKGENHPQNKLNAKQVRVIRWWKIINPEMSQRKISDFFKVSTSTISNISNKASLMETMVLLFLGAISLFIVN